MEKASVVFCVWDKEGQNCLHVIIWNKNALDVDFIVRLKHGSVPETEAFQKTFWETVQYTKLYMTVWRQLMFK